MLHEFIVGIPSENLSETRANKLLGLKDTKQVLTDLGKMIASDICFNNTERFPILKKAEGNPHNLIFQVDPEPDF
jgi:hypothetical protein